METQLLRDENVFPTQEVLQKALGKRYAVYKELIDTITGDNYDLTLEWRFYKDGKAWLGKVEYTKPKKHIFSTKTGETRNDATISRVNSTNGSSNKSPSSTGKKTIFWLSIWEGFFKIGFYFTEKTRGGVMDLDIDKEIKTSFADAEAVGKLILLSLNIDKKRQIRNVMEIIKYKKTLK